MYTNNRNRALSSRSKAKVTVLMNLYYPFNMINATMFLQTR